MKKFEITAAKYIEICRQIRKECEEYLTQIAKAWNGIVFPLHFIASELECDEALCCITYDGGNHPEYASNAFSEVESVYIKDNELTFSIEDDGRYACSSVLTDDLINIAWAVDAAIDYVMDNLIGLIGGSGTIMNGRWTVTRETWDKLVDLAEGRDNIDHYLDGDNEKWLQSIRECYNPQGFVTLIKSVAQIGDKEVTWEWQ